MDLDETIIKVYDPIADGTVDKTSIDMSTKFTNTFDHSTSGNALDYVTVGAGTAATTKITYAGAVEKEFRLVLYKLKAGGTDTNDAD